MKQVTVPLYVFQKVLQGSSKGIAFIDSTPLSVCHICRSSSHKLFKDVAAKGKTSTGWFFGLKLHVIVNHKGEIITWSLTQGNVSDLSQVQPLCKNLKGKLVGDREYISSKLFNLLIEEGLQLLTRIRSNMKNILMDTFDKCLLKKRALIESVFALFKTKYHTLHHRHRSKVNFFINLLGGLIAYSVSKKKTTPRNVWVN